jgi:hypothetical protein
MILPFNYDKWKRHFNSPKQGITDAAKGAKNDVMVLMSSSGTEVSWEDPAWGHSAFTRLCWKALFKAGPTGMEGAALMWTSSTTMPANGCLSW